MNRKIAAYITLVFFVSLISITVMLYRSATLSSARVRTPRTTPTPTPIIQTATTATQTDFDKLALILEDVQVSDGYRYDAKDSQGSNLDAIKVIQPTSARKYLAVYHSFVNNIFTVKLAESTDLLTWTFKTNLDTNATHAEIMTFPQGDFLVAYEKFTSTSSSIHLRHYKDYQSLIRGQFLSEKQIPRVLSNTNEGTPNIISVKKKAFDTRRGRQDWSSSSIVLGFHYYNSVTDKNATGTLTNWSSWKAVPNTMVNNYFDSLGYTGNYGDRDDFSYKFDKSKLGTINYIIHEAQITKDAWESWRSFLYDAKNKKFQQLDPYTHNRSIAFANASVTPLTLPNGTNGIFVGYYIFSEGAAPGEAGSLIFYTKEANAARATLPENRAPIIPTVTPTSPPLPTDTPVPTSSGITCTCTEPGGAVPNNGFSCTDGDSRYCAADEYCTTSSMKPAWPCAKL